MKVALIIITILVVLFIVIYSYYGEFTKISFKIENQGGETILKIKWKSERQKEKFFGIDIYQAVIDEGIETFDDFKLWKQNKKEVGISLWEPNVEIRKCL